MNVAAQVAIDSDKRASTSRTIGVLGYFTLAVGAIVGSAWVIVLGDWLASAGPGGAAVGFALGGVAMTLVGLCYAELAARNPSFGGEFVYVLRTMGQLPAFLVGWFLTLYAVSICAFEGVAVAALLGNLVPASMGPVAYALGRSEVHVGALIVGVVAVITIGTLHYAGVTSAIRFQNLATVGFLLVLAVLVVAGILLGSPRNWQPMFRSTSHGSVLAGIAWVFSNCALFLNGWQTSLHAIEDRRAGLSIRAVIMAMLTGIVVGAVAYCAVVLSASAASPWQRLLHDPLPAVAAFSSLPPHGVWGIIVVVASLVSAFKTWNALAWVATRLIVAQAREGFVPRSLATLHPHSGAPRGAIVIVTFLCLSGPLLGRAAIVPIVDMASICLAFSVIVCLLALLRLRARSPGQSTFSVPGGTATILLALALVCAMIGIAIIEPLFGAHSGLPIEWKLIGAWGSIGLVVWATMQRSQRR